jgi:peroxiredoxin
MKNKADLALKIALGVLVAALAGVIVSSLRQRVVEVGDRAPNFHITTDQGKEISLKDFGGKVLVLNFWAAWCEPCVEETPSLNEFTRATADSGVVVLGVSVDRNQKLYEQFKRRFQIAFQTSRDPDENLSSSFGTFKYPETYIIDRQGVVRQKIISNRDWTDPAIVSFVKAL